MRTSSPPARVLAIVFAVGICAAGPCLSAQTVIKLPKNNYTPQQDVELGRQAAAEVRKEYPVIREERIASYLSTLGDRLVTAAPTELKQSAYEFSFTPIDLKDINAFALPGGPMFVLRGMFDAAASEAEVAGVMAHELSHVLLRHGTANMTKAQNPWLQLGQLAGAIGGAMVGGVAGSAIAGGAQLGLGSVLLRYSRDFEKQADLMGAQIMARAGYDPRALAQMFETIESKAESTGGSGPQWMSSHPNPGNRTKYINQEADQLKVATAPDMSGFQPIKTAFASLPPAKSMGDLAKGNVEAGSKTAPPTSVGIPGQPVPKPSSTYSELRGGNVFLASVPADWTGLQSKTSIKVVPQNGYGQLNGQTVFTHGIEFGVTQAASRDLREATTALLRGVAQSNPELRLVGQPQTMRLSQHSAIETSLVNRAALGGQERIKIYTALLSDGTLFYYLTVVPESDADAFEEVFRHVAESIRLTDR